MQIFDGRQLKEAVETFNLDIKCSDSLSDWYLTLDSEKGAIFLNWELDREKVVDLFLKQSNRLSLDFYVGDIDLSQELKCYGPWVPFEMIDFWELAEILQHCEVWHVRYLLHVQTGSHLPILF